MQLEDYMDTKIENLPMQPATGQEGNAVMVRSIPAPAA
jgi:hypothetical protein